MTDDEIKRAKKTIALVDRNLKKWQAWFPIETSGVEIPRVDLLALCELAREIIRLTDPEPVTVDAKNSPHKLMELESETEQEGV